MKGKIIVISIVVVLLIVGSFYLAYSNSEEIDSHIYVINGDDCSLCEQVSKLFLDTILEDNNNAFKVNILEAENPVAQKFISDYNIEFFPAIFVVTEDKNFSDIMPQIDKNIYGLYSAESYRFLTEYTYGMISPRQYANKVPAEDKIVIFSDYLDPYSVVFFNDFMPYLKNKYDVEIVDIKYPLSEESYALTEGYKCASANGFGEEYNEIVYSKGIDLYKSLSEDENITGEQAIEIKQEVYSDINEFVPVSKRENYNECMSKDLMIDSITDDMDYAYSLFVYTTPLMIVNDKIIPATIDYELMDALIQKELNQEGLNQKQ